MCRMSEMDSNERSLSSSPHQNHIEINLYAYMFTHREWERVYEIAAERYAYNNTHRI